MLINEGGKWMIVTYAGPASKILHPPWRFYIGIALTRQHKRVNGVLSEVRYRGYTIDLAMFGYFIRLSWLPFKTIKEI